MSDSWLKLFINFACLPRETDKARALEIDLRRVEANLSTDEEEKLSSKYMQKMILQKYEIMRDDPFKDQTITHSRRYYNETENNTLPEHYIWKGL